MNAPHRKTAILITKIFKKSYIPTPNRQIVHEYNELYAGVGCGVGWVYDVGFLQNYAQKLGFGSINLMNFENFNGIEGI